ncbi:MAG: hypothetical protein KAG98_05080 [Lentisphaeria bacterium]|nr:hypothetical protein [Lentisphaeria bacterium]
MTMKIFKFTTMVVTLFMLAGCLHNPEVPFVRPNPMSAKETESIEKTASIIFSDLLFESPLGDRSFSSVKFDHDIKNERLVSLEKVMKRLIRKDSTIFCVSEHLKTQTFNIKFVINQDSKKSITVSLVDNYTKEVVYQKVYQLSETGK